MSVSWLSVSQFMYFSLLLLSHATTTMLNVYMPCLSIGWFIGIMAYYYVRHWPLYLSVCVPLIVCENQKAKQIYGDSRCQIDGPQNDFIRLHIHLCYLLPSGSDDFLVVPRRLFAVFVRIIVSWMGGRDSTGRPNNNQPGNGMMMSPPMSFSSHKP